jgi:hypothetical protein
LVSCRIRSTRSEAEGKTIRGFLRARFLPFAMAAGICFLLVSLVIESVLKGLSHHLQASMAGGATTALLYLPVFRSCSGHAAFRYDR